MLIPFSNFRVVKLLGAHVLKMLVKIFRRSITTRQKWPSAGVGQVRCCHRPSSSLKQVLEKPETIEIVGKTYKTDSWTNITPRIISKVGKNLHNRPHHPINLIRQRIVNYFYSSFTSLMGNPLFAVFDSMDPVVTVKQNFDSLLVPSNHVSRSRSDTYYINKDQLLRAHTSAHQEELLKMGFDQFLAVGDVYRRDEIDSCHYPIFHQMEGVRIFNKEKVCLILIP